MSVEVTPADEEAVRRLPYYRQMQRDMLCGGASLYFAARVMAEHRMGMFEEGTKE